MPIGDEREGQRAGLAQGVNDEVLAVVGVRCMLERSLGDGVDGGGI